MFAAVVISLLVLGIFIMVQSEDADAPGGVTNMSKNEVAFDKSKHSLSDPNSLWVIVNKKRPLPQSYVPAKLVTPSVPVRSGGEEGTVRSETAKALETLFGSAKKQGYDLLFVSGYRSYALQTSVYNRYVNTLGQAEADRISAKPGTSEHQTGLAADVGTTDRVCELEICFGDTPAGKWIAANAYKHGFIVRYTKDKEAVTGYSYEPWHLRYVGKELAAELKRTNIQTLEGFFNL